MDTTTLISTFLLTMLMLIGLWFFIRASVKDRTEVLRLGSEQDVEQLHDQLKRHFSDRAYAVKAFDSDRQVVTWEGFVQPSLALALLLSALATIGLFCLSLVLLLALPAVGPSWFAIVLFAPAAGTFYWRGAGRLEEVSYRVYASEQEPAPPSVLSISAHRDEILALQQAFRFTPLEA
jgi:hypothetical protein